MKIRYLFFLLFSISLFGIRAQNVPFVIDTPIQNTSDDAEEYVANGQISLGSSDLEMTFEGTQQQLIGLRFTNINLLQGATIDRAFIQFTVDETDTEPTSLLIEGELSTSSQTFNSDANNISSRTKTVASIAWNDIPAWDVVGENGPDQRTPEITDIIQELVDQPNWEAGNAMTFIISGTTGTRNAISSDNGANLPPRLLIYSSISEFPIVSFPIIEDALWKYEDSGADLGTDWVTLDFDDTSWDFGQAQLGYGDDDERTVLDFGTDPDNKHITYYFRKKFKVTSPEEFDELTLRLQHDDGAVVYLNGQEVIRSNMPDGTIDFQTTAVEDVEGDSENAFETFGLDNVLNAGENIIAVEIHQATVKSSDVSFSLSLEGKAVLPPAIQLIHNSPDPSLTLVDIYIDAGNTGNFVKFNGDTPIPFRFGTAYLTDLPPGTHSVAVSPFGQEDFMWNATEFTLENDKRYIAMVHGVREPENFETGFNNAEAIAFRIQVDEVPGLADESVNVDETLPLLFHGVPDLPNIRIVAVGVGDATGDYPEGIPYGFPIQGGTVNALPYPNVQLTNNSFTEVYGEYKVDLVPYAQRVVTLYTSGFHTTEGNTGVDSPNFGLYIMPAEGGPAVELPAPDPPQPGKVQIIHNAPDEQLASVDIWMNGNKIVEAFDYLEATKFIDIPAGLNRIAISPHSTTAADTAWSATDVLVEADLDVTTFQTIGRTYTLMAYGARNTTAFENSINSDVSFGIAFEEGREVASISENVDLRFFHGATDLQGIDAILEGQLIPIINDLPFGQYSANYVTLPTEAFQVNLTQQENNESILYANNLDLEDRAGEALVLLAAGMLEPSEGQPGFGVYMVDVESVVTLLEEVDIATPLNVLTEEFGIKVYPNPVTDYLTIQGPIVASQMRLFRADGKILRHVRESKDQVVIQMKDLPDGIYFLEVQLPEETRIVKILKE